MAMPRMRTIKEAHQELKQLDPNTAVTEYYIKQLVLSGQIPFVTAGRKRLLNFDALLSYLENPAQNNHSERIQIGKIRCVG